MYNWRGKKLLVLGATKIIGEIVDAAHRYGAHVIVADYNPDAPAKKIADESVLLNVMDVDAVVNYVREHNVDGIITGFTDILMLPYVKICERTGHHCCLNAQMVAQTTDKAMFKKLCHDFDINTVQEFDDVDKMTYPVLVKPVDNSGSRGIYICNNRAEYDVAVANALRFSNSRHILTERYITLPEATVFYVFDNGMAHMTAMADRHVTQIRDDILRLPSGYTFPSVGTENFMAHSDKKFQSMFAHMGIKNGMIFIQGFLDENNEFIPYECGLRLTGSLEYKLIERVCGYNPLSMLINYAFCGSMTARDEISHINPLHATHAYNISVLIRPGKISEISGVDEIRNTRNVLDVFLSYDIGDELGEESWGRLSQVAVRIFFVSENAQEYQSTINIIKNNLKILDENGNDMILTKEIVI
ncbi:MAG: ATP-grasp domain-containing protein [Alphaproteobacteria bacterium]|nr:ATP-grasp domain-containing protein [Alphaproteobacteria bacterium]